MNMKAVIKDDERIKRGIMVPVRWLYPDQSGTAPIGDPHGDRFDASGFQLTPISDYWLPAAVYLESHISFFLQEF